MGKRKIISHNPNPAALTLVNSKEGDHFRRKRGTVKKAELNDAFKAQASNTCSAEARQIMEKLKPFTQQMYGRIQVYLSGRLRKGLLSSGKLNYAQCEGWEVMKDYPLNKIYREQWKVRKEKNTVFIDVPAETDSVNAENKMATHYYFEAMLVHGDAAVPGALRMESDRSDLFAFGREYKTSYSFSFVLPEGRPYLIFLKIGCMNKDMPAEHPRHYGMKVVAVG